MDVKKIKIVGLLLIVVFLAVDVLLFLYLQRHNIGFRPRQDISFSHKTHSGKFGITCLFCHTNAENHSYANYPTTKTCMICHIALRTENKLLKSIIYSYDSMTSILYKRIYKLPEYVRFNHSLHLRSGIDCATCHSFVEQMDSLYLARPLTMGWCVDCHRDPLRYAISPRKISGIFYPEDTTEMWISLKEFEIFQNHKSAKPLNFFLSPKQLKPASIECSICHY